MAKRVFPILFLLLVLIGSYSNASTEEGSTCSKLLSSDAAAALILKTEEAKLVFNTWGLVFGRTSPNFSMAVLMIFSKSEDGMRGEVDQRYFLSEITRISHFEPETARKYMIDFLRDGVLGKKALKLTPEGLAYLPKLPPLYLIY